MFRITCTNVGLETRFIASKIRYRDTKRMVIMRATNLLNHSFFTDINLREKICKKWKLVGHTFDEYMFPYKKLMGRLVF